jgi:hypothetical protein
LLPMAEDDFWEEIRRAAQFDEPIAREDRAKLMADVAFAALHAIFATRAAGAEERDAALEEAVRLAGLVVWSSVDTEPPAWWEAHSRRVFEDFRAMQGAALAMVGRSQPLEIANVAAYLQQRRTREAEIGDRGLFLHYPTGDERSVYSFLEVWSGYAMADYQAEFLVSHFNHAEYEARRLEWLEAKQQPLAKLVLMQDDIARRTGCEEWQVTQYLLCDVVPMLPWVRFKTPGRFGGGEVIEIVVGSPRVPPKAVAAAYAAFRRRDDSTIEQARPSRSEWPTRIEAFVMEFRAKLSGRRFLWNDCFTAFVERYPDQPYKDTSSFKSKYYARQAEAR